MLRRIFLVLLQRDSVKLKEPAVVERVAMHRSERPAKVATIGEEVRALSPYV